MTAPLQDKCQAAAGRVPAAVGSRRSRAPYEVQCSSELRWPMRKFLILWLLLNLITALAMSMPSSATAEAICPPSADVHSRLSARLWDLRQIRGGNGVLLVVF